MFVLKKKYLKLLVSYESVKKTLQEYKEKENNEIVQWVVKVKDCDELFIVYGTHVGTYWVNGILTELRIWKSNKLVGVFSNVQYVVRYDDYGIL